MLPYTNLLLLFKILAVTELLTLLQRDSICVFFAVVTATRFVLVLWHYITES